MPYIGGRCVLVLTGRYVGAPDTAEWKTRPHSLGVRFGRNWIRLEQKLHTFGIFQISWSVKFSSILNYLYSCKYTDRYVLKVPDLSFLAIILTQADNRAATPVNETESERGVEGCCQIQPAESNESVG